MMSAGGITIDDGTMIAANVQLISNNHDLYERQIIICKPVHVSKNAWIELAQQFCPVLLSEIVLLSEPPA